MKLHSIEVAVVREDASGKKFTERAIVKPVDGSFATYGDARADVHKQNAALLLRISRVAAADNASEG